MNWIIGGVVAAVIVAIGLGVWAFLSAERFNSVTTSEGIELLEGNTVDRVELTEGSQRLRLWLSEPTTTMDKDGKTSDAGDLVEFRYVRPQAEQVADLVADAQPELGYDSQVPQESVWGAMLTMLIPLVIIFGVFLYFFPKIQSGAGGFGKARDRSKISGDHPGVTFADVAGEAEAVAELREITEFLTAPERFHAMGAKIPRGVLLYGPPGTGKTLLARAVAGEAGVPFYSISASEFVEMYVGVGASRVRKLFDQAKQHAPAIVFVDEIDAVGRGRGIGTGGGNDEREQTLNQLLVELDGFDERSNVILIAATNRPDVLDPALLRPGRFDRQIAVDAPDLIGREGILAVHAVGKPLDDSVDLVAIARRTPGFTGADLANVLNEAALLAARVGSAKITDEHIDEAIDRVVAGPQRESRAMNAEDKRMTAYHEGGHALVAAALRHTDPVTKVTILPRGSALGYTMVMPTEDRYSVSRNQLLDQMAYAMGGRVAEEIVFHDPSTGASNDIQKATAVARKMVTEYGMTSAVGAVRLVADQAAGVAVAGGASSGDGVREHSDALTDAVDQQVRGLIDAAHGEAWRILEANRDVLDILASRLLDKETVLEAELAQIFTGLTKAPARERWLSGPNRVSDDRPPVPIPVQDLVAEGKHVQEEEQE
ncbi:MAG: ATP-dependent zinc metalloprotease FtsH [Ancrocorticia sp.]|uniref:ATP-dependent zinc metalloprotease FtsH n=1 Tax=Ancrocorticia sp. TaxID=2593684 RepID=UPI003F90F48E